MIEEEMMKAGDRVRAHTEDSLDGLEGVVRDVFKSLYPEYGVFIPDRGGLFGFDKEELEVIEDA